MGVGVLMAYFDCLEDGRHGERRARERRAIEADGRDGLGWGIPARGTESNLIAGAGTIKYALRTVAICLGE